jgi:hypothetical protein
MQKSNSEIKSCSVISYYKYVQFYVSINIKISVIFFKITCYLSKNVHKVNMWILFQSFAYLPGFGWFTNVSSHSASTNVDVLLQYQPAHDQSLWFVRYCEKTHAKDNANAVSTMLLYIIKLSLPKPSYFSMIYNVTTLKWAVWMSFSPYAHASVTTLSLISGSCIKSTCDVHTT